MRMDKENYIVDIEFCYQMCEFPSHSKALNKFL